MSSFGTGTTTTTGGSSIVLTAFTGTNGAQAGTDGLVPTIRQPSRLCTWSRRRLDFKYLGWDRAQ